MERESGQKLPARQLGQLCKFRGLKQETREEVKFQEEINKFGIRHIDLKTLDDHRILAGISI